MCARAFSVCGPKNEAEREKAREREEVEEAAPREAATDLWKMCHGLSKLQRQTYLLILHTLVFQALLLTWRSSPCLARGKPWRQRGVNDP